MAGEVTEQPANIHVDLGYDAMLHSSAWCEGKWNGGNRAAIRVRESAECARDEELIVFMALLPTPYN